MTAVADALLAGAKQYAQYIKRQTGLPLSKAQQITASVHRFADWHELGVVSNASPFDMRMRAAGMSSRSWTGVRTDAAIEIAKEAAGRLSASVDIDPAQAKHLNLSARGFNEESQLSSGAHLDLSVGQDVENVWVERPCRVNLFDPCPRLVLIAGATGTGKTGLATAIAGNQSRHGGEVVYMSQDMDMQGYTSEFDSTGKLLKGLFSGGALSVVGPSGIELANGTKVPLSTASGERWKVRDTIDALGKLKGMMRPFSVVIFDDALLGFSNEEEAKEMSELIDGLLSDGVSIVMTTQDSIDELPFSQEAARWLTVFQGRMSHYAQARSRNRSELKSNGSRHEALVNLYLRDVIRSAYDEVTRRLVYKRNEYTSWLMVSMGERVGMTAEVVRVGWPSIIGSCSGAEPNTGK